MTTVYCTEGGARLDVFLTDETEFTRSHIKNLIDGGKVFIGGVAAVKAGQTVRTGDEVSFEDIVESDDVEPEDIPLDVVYEDNDIAVINASARQGHHGAYGGVQNGRGARFRRRAVRGAYGQKTVPRGARQQS